MSPTDPSDGNDDSERTTPRKDESILERLTRRVIWTEETTDCTQCGSTIALDRGHYYAVVEAAESRRSAADRREVVFCSRSCAS